MIYTFAHQINRAKTLLEGLTTYAEQLAQWGITTEFLTKTTELYNQANQLEQKRNALKASSQEATAEQEQVMTDLNSQCGVAKKLVRIALPEESWPAFGFRAGEYASKSTTEVTTT
jgi:hypothetical protein